MIFSIHRTREDIDHLDHFYFTRRTRRICEEFDLQAKEYRRRDWPVPNHMKNLDDPVRISM